MKTFHLLTKVLWILLFSQAAAAEVIFEGYYKLTLASQHIGYIIQRYDLDVQNKSFSSVYYVFTKTAEGTSTESLNAKATSKLEPVSYQYTRLEGNTSKAIDAIVKTANKKSRLVIKTIENGKAKPVKEIQLGEQVFFSTFLSHLMLKNPKGISVGNKFSYDAVAEEDGEIQKGEVFVKEQVKEKGLDTFRTLNTFKKEEFVNWVNIKGESVKTQVPKLNLAAELMANPKDAYLDMPFSESSIRLLFGDIPAGKTNLLNKQ